MSFYEQIAKYYDLIFPIRENQLKFIKDIAGNAPKSLLDVACGTGGYALELSKAGYQISAIDYDLQMIEHLIEKAHLLNRDLTVINGDMLKIKDLLTTTMDTIYCIGNSLVHLNHLTEIEDFLSQAYALLNEDGSLIVQIINYDRILKYHITSLPLIENEHLRFIRSYSHQSDDKILFKTVLEVNHHHFENVIPLLPLSSDALITALKKSGFKTYDLYGDFSYTPYDEDSSYSLVVHAKK